MDVETLKTNIKHFLKNPNTLTFFLVIGLIVVVYFVYDGMVKRAVAPVSLPYSTKLLTEGTEITNDAIGTVKLSGTFITSSGENLIQNRNSLVQKYVGVGYQIQANSFFYRNALSTQEDTNKPISYDMPDNYSIFSLDVNFHTTYGCSIMPGNYIDLYFKAMDKNNDNKIIFEPFITSIPVDMVIDKDGNNVFTHTDDNSDPKPTQLWFAVPTEYKELLEKAMLVKIPGLEIIPVPRNAEYSENPEPTKIASEAVKAYIESETVPILN